MRKLLVTNLSQLILVILAFLVMVLMSYFFASGIVEKYIFANADEVVTNADTVITAKLREAEVSVINISLSLRNRLENSQTVEEIHRYLRELTRFLRASEGTVFVSVYGVVNGRFIDGNDWTPPADYRPLDQPWYRAAMEHPGEVVILPPYPDARDGSIILTASRVLDGSGGEVYGVICYDMYFLDIEEYVKTLRFSEGGYGMLLAPDFTILVHPEDSYLGKPMGKLSEAHAMVTRELGGGSPKVSLVKLENHQNKEVVAFYHRMPNGWYIGIATPKVNYYQDVYRMAVVLSILGFILSAMLCVILIRMSIARYHSEEENRSKTSFLARMSHEIRTPMNSILGASNIMIRKKIPRELLEYITIIRESGTSLLSIINDILDFSKMEVGFIHIENKDYSLSSLINDVINVIRGMLIEKPLDFFVFVDSGVPERLNGDKARLRQVLINLLNNAVKYTKKGYLSLHVNFSWLDARKLRLSFNVSDTGIGIKKEDIKNLFKDFSRVDMENNEGVEGTGLGLAIANRLCQAMEGGITVESEYGKGSVFTASLVQSCEEPQAIARVDNPEQKRVFFYEERPVYARFLLEAFTNLGVHPAQVQSLSAFMERLEQGTGDFAFVSSRYAAECVSRGERGNTAARLVVMTELRNVFVYPEGISVSMPVYAPILANVLNGAAPGESALPPPEEDFPEMGEARFTAPAARALIVDDIATNLKVAVELMAPYKIRIDTCSSGGEALGMVQKHRYDLVFMDHMMPGMDGLETTSRIRNLNKNDRYFTSLPVIMLTANVIVSQREMFFKSGVNDFLGKPIDVQELCRVLEKWIPGEKRLSREEGGEPAAGETFPEIPGLSVQEGLRYLGGSAAAYADVLGVFRADAEEKAGQIREAAEREDWELFTALVHAIKGAARGVGAAGLGDLAAGLEQAGRSRDLAVIGEQTPGFLRDLTDLAGAVKNTLARISRQEKKREPAALSGF
ncbi:MAG: response regulator [Treponema sp.]|jgi:signal transduction histidine kinase/CheY-like chemotaxis protein/HPt (histidine-containing phosphotransfer) domain-containing protein|nr:response regulator [Treponema sp.]